VDRGLAAVAADLEHRPAPGVTSGRLVQGQAFGGGHETGGRFGRAQQFGVHALSSSLRASSPQPDRRISRLSPVFCRTFWPGAPAVPLAERVMFLMRRSSTLIMSNRRAMSVDAFSAQSFRASASRALSRGTVSLTPARLFDPRLARARLR